MARPSGGVRRNEFIQVDSKRYRPALSSPPTASSRASCPPRRRPSHVRGLRWRRLLRSQGWVAAATEDMLAPLPPSPPPAARLQRDDQLHGQLRPTAR